MRSSSNINSSLNKKRRQILLRKVIILSVVFFFLIIGTLFGITSNKLKIQNISVTGNTSISREQILSMTDNGINKKYVWFIPTNNFFLLRRSIIESDILNNVQRVKSVDVSFVDLNTLDISIVERQPYALWCSGTANAQGACYFIDKEGLVFSQADDTGTTTQKYFGLIQGDPIGKIYFPNNIDGTASVGSSFSVNRFKNISAFFSLLIKMNLEPVSFSAIDDHEYEINLSYGGKILLNNSKPFEKSITNLQALLDGGYIKTDESFLKKIKYIDLRYGNKVDFKLN